MSATTVPVRRDWRLSATGVLASEWTKLRSLRSTWWTLGVAVAMSVGLSALIAAAASQHSGGDSEGGLSGTFLTLQGLSLAQLAVAVLGVLVVTGEYSTGMIRASLTAVPRRLPVLWAKATVFAVLTAAVMSVTTLVTFFVGSALLGSAGASLTDPGVLEMLAGSAGLMVLAGLLGVGLGAILRSTAGGITVAVGVLFVVPVLASMLPEWWQDHVVRYLPSTGADAMMRGALGTGDLSQVGGTVLLGAWVVLTLAVGAALLVRRDA